MGLSRRQFLGATGALFGLTAMGSIGTFALSLETEALQRLGLVFHNPKAYPQLINEFTDGLLQGFPKGQKLSNFQAESNLVDFARANDTIISYISPSSAVALQNHLAEEHVQLAAVDLGMDMQRFSERMPRLAYISLNYWQLAQALALWVKGELAQRLLIVVDSYESGYDSFSVFESNFPQAKIVVYGTESLSQSLNGEAFEAIAFAVHGENAQRFMTEYDSLGLKLPLIRLPFVGSPIHSIRPIYSASFAFDNTPFYTLGQRTAMTLQGQGYDETAILIKHAQHPIAQYLGSQLPYHGISNRVKTGWTNPYPI